MDNDTKIVVKRYRTELSAMSASLCSTLAAVSVLKAVRRASPF